MLSRWKKWSCVESHSCVRSSVYAKIRRLIEISTFVVYHFTRAANPTNRKFTSTSHIKRNILSLHTHRRPRVYRIHCLGLSEKMLKFTIFMVALSAYTTHDRAQQVHATEREMRREKTISRSVEIKETEKIFLFNFLVYTFNICSGFLLLTGRRLRRVGIWENSLHRSAT